MIIESTRLGELEVEQDKIINFPRGIPGFSEEKEFVLLPYDNNSPFMFLQSVSEPNLTFLTVDPFCFFKDYEFKLDDQVVEYLELSTEQPPYILNIITVPEKAEEMTANLLAPIIINHSRRMGQQIVLEKSPFTTRHSLFPNGFPKPGPQGGR